MMTMDISLLIITLQYLVCWRDYKVQIDIVVLDLAKAFEIVPNESLLDKLEHYHANSHDSQILIGIAASGSRDW